MGRYIRRCGRVLLLLPVAVAIHVKKQMRGRGIEVVLCLGMLLIIGTGGLCLWRSQVSAGVLEENITEASAGSFKEYTAGTGSEVPSGGMEEHAAGTGSEMPSGGMEEPVAAAGSEAPAEPVSVTLSFAGDCTLGMDPAFTYASSFNAQYDQEGPAYFFAQVRDIFERDDLTVVNFEGTLTESRDRADKTWAFRGERAYAEVLAKGAVEAANLANNHSSDYGPDSFQDTKEALETAGIATFGYEDTAIVEVKGVKVGLLGMYTVYENEAYPTYLKRAVKALKDRGAALIVASFHWGLERSYVPEADQVALAHEAIDAGAHLVIGHHPHVLQGIEIYRGRYIVYSLGNFCFGGNCDPPDYDCIIFQQTFTITNGVPAEDNEVQIIPCSVSSVSGWNNYQPTPAEGEEKTRILEKLREISREIPSAIPDGTGEKGVQWDDADA